MNRSECKEVTDLASVALASFEHASVVVSGHVPKTAQNVVDVLAQRGSLGAIFATTDAEFVGSDEVRPLVQLLQLTAERA